MTRATDLLSRRPLAGVALATVVSLCLAVSALPAQAPVLRAQAPVAKPSAAPPAAAPAAAAATLQPGEIDLARSRTFIKVGAKGIGHEHGIVGRLASGKLTLGAARGAGRLVFDIKSFAADTPEARKFVGLSGETDKATQQQINDNMLGSAVLDAKRFPQAVFEIESALPQPSAAHPGTYMLKGQFTLHGVTKPLDLPVKAEAVEGQARLRGQFNLLQTDFGIKPFSKLLGTIGVADSLTIWGELWLPAGA